MDLISVIVPIYNVEKYLSKCVDSIINQTYQNTEIILVDDGSPDGCGKICDEYVQSDSRIRVIHKPNGGLSDARNCGLDNVHGDYVVFIDSDDYIAPDMISCLYERIKKDNTDIALCNFTYVDEDYEEIESRKNKSPIKNCVVSKDEALSFLCNDSNWYYVIACNKLYKKEIFDGLRFPYGKIHEDEFVIHHIFERCNSISCIEEPLYYYFQRIGSITQQKNSAKLFNKIEALHDRLIFSINNRYSFLSYCTLKKLAYQVSYFDTQYDHCLNYDKVHTLYRNISRKVPLRGLSLKRKLIVGINSVFPDLMLRYYRRLLLSGE